MKTDRAFLKVGEETFIERASNALEPTCSNVKIVINENQKSKFEKAFPSFDFIFDVHARRGALGGIHAALKNCASDWAVILAVDLPFVTGEAIECLARTAVESKDISAAVAPKQTDGRLQPLCAVYRVADCLPELETLLKKTASASVNDFLKLIPCHFIEQNELAADGRENLLYNVNEPDEYRLIMHSSV